MKTLTKCLFLLLISMVVLAGCINPLVKNTTDQSVLVVTEKGVNSDVEDSDVEDVIPMKEYSCKMLRSKSEEDNCKEMVNEMIADELISEIIRTYDIKRCDELDISRMENCKNHIESTGVNGPISEDEIKAYGNAMGMIYGDNEEDGDAEGYYDLARCDELKTSGFAEYCKLQLTERIEEELLWKIIESGDSSRCGELKIEGVNIMCKEEFGIYKDEEEDIPEPIESDNVIE